MSNGYGWAIVQHSGYGYAGKPGFEHAVETRALIVNAERKRVLKVGGLVFGSHREAEGFAETANFPEDSRDIYPHARGTFSEEKLDGLRIYIPVREATG